MHNPRLALITDRIPGDLEADPVCPGRKPPFWAVKPPARPYKKAIDSEFMIENAKAV
jgi:hypothetical protein